MTSTSYVNGQYVKQEDASINIDDRGYVFSDGVYEVMLVINNKFIDWQEHCERLQYSLDGLKIKYEVSSQELKKIANQLLQRNNLDNAIIYLQITRGEAKRDHKFPSPTTKPSIIMTASPSKLPSKENYDNGVSIITTADLRWKRRDLKTISLLANILAKQEAVEKDATETILVEEDGFVTEGSSTNFFIVDSEGYLRTHPKNNRILGGITRQGVLKVANQNNLKIKEEAFKIDDIFNAKEAFITSTTKHILPVTTCDNKKIADGKVGKITKELMQKYKEYIEAQ